MLIRSWTTLFAAAFVSMVLLTWTLTALSPNPSAAAATMTSVQLAPVMARQVQRGETFFTNQVQIAYHSGSVILSGDPAPLNDFLVDDGMRITVTRPDGTTATWSNVFEVGCLKLVPLPPTDIRHLFLPGTNTVSVSLFDVCGVSAGVPSAIFLTYETSGTPVPSPCTVRDDFSTYPPGQPPAGWTQHGSPLITPVVEEVGGVGPAYRLLSFPLLGAGRTSKFLIKDGSIVGSATIITKLNFQSNNDEGGLVIFQDQNNHIVITANPFWDYVLIIEAVDGVWRQAAHGIGGELNVATGRDYWLRVDTFAAGTNGGKTVVVSWSTDGVNFVERKRLNNLTSITGQVGYVTWSFSPPHVHFDDFSVSEICEGTTASTDLSVSKTTSSNLAFVGDTLTYDLVVQNHGPSAATDVTLMDALPVGVTAVSASSAQGSCVQADRTVTCSLGSLANGASSAVTVAVKPTASAAGGTIINIASVVGTEADPNTANNTATVTTSVACNSPYTHLNLCQLQKGDILLEVANNDEARVLGYIATYWYHAGIYDGAGNVLEASNPREGVQSKPIEDTGFYLNAVDWVVLRLKSEHQSKVEQAISWAREKADDPNVVFMPVEEWLNPGNKLQASKFYCSLFVWHAFFEAGLDLDRNLGIFNQVVPGGKLGNILQQVLPDDLYASAFAPLAPTTVVQDRNPGFLRTLYALLSPADLRVTDAAGASVGIDPQTQVVVNTIPGAFYSGQQSEPEWIAIPNIGGPSRVEVYGTDTGSYTLGIQVAGSQTFQSQVFQWETRPGQVDSFSVAEPHVGPAQLEPVLLTVPVDIKPGSDTNPISLKGKGDIPVVILTTATFDATTVDALSVRFGPGGAREVHNRGHIEDVNKDGKSDLMLHFHTEETGITAGATQACLTGQTKAGLNIRGCDVIRIVP